MFELVLTCPEAQVETVTEALEALDALSVSIEDNDADTPHEQALFGEPGMPPPKEAWLHSRLTALFPNQEQAQAALDLLEAQPFFADSALVALREVANEDWVRLTQSQFSPVPVTSDFWIVPSWHTSPNPDAINIVLDPGLAFGTGSHPTTHLCLEWLIKEVNINDHVLDYGCGSGILSIAAKKCGAKEVIGVDIDPQAIIASKHNAQENHVDIQFYNSESSLTFEADIVIANILSSALSVLAPIIAKACRPEGKIALSGILKEQVEMLTQIYSAWFNLKKPIEREGWILLSGTKKSIS